MLGSNRKTSPSTGPDGPLKPPIKAVPRNVERKPSWKEDMVALTLLKPGWDGGEADPPNKESLEKSRRFAVQAETSKLLPSRILPCADGGVTLLFRGGKKLAVVECFNSGSSILGTSGPDMPTEVEEFDFARAADLETCIERIDGFLRG